MSLLRRGAEQPAATQTPTVEETAQHLGQLLLERASVSREQLQDALKRQRHDRRRLGEILVDLGMSEADLIAVLAMQQDRHPVDLTASKPDEDALLSVDAELVRRYEVLPLAVDEKGRLHMATAMPDDNALAATLAERTGREVVLELAGRRAIHAAIDKHYTVLHRVDAAAERAVSEQEVTEAPRAPIAVAPDAPVVEIVDLLLTQALRDRASDIHIEPQADRLRVRYRVDGVLHEVQSLPATLGVPVLSRIKIMAEMDIVDRHRPQDGQMTVDIEGRAIDVRVATMETVWGEKAALRLLDPTRVLVEMSSLGLTENDESMLRRLIAAPFGLLVVSGPTGSGKTTSLYAALNELDREGSNITTIEDPVEYQFERINQIQINRLAGVTFANGLRAILRQDPDVVLVGEVRDIETAQIAVQAALTGHLVLCSIHASDAAGALHRFLDMNVEPYLLASAAIGVMAQRLIRLSCTHCLAGAPIRPEEVAFYTKVMGHEPNPERRAGIGCNRCGGTGFRERRGVFEVMPVNDEMRQLIVDKAQLAEIQRVAMAAGMRSLQQAGCDVADQGLTTLSEVMRRVYTI